MIWIIIIPLIVLVLATIHLLIISLNKSCLFFQVLYYKDLLMYRSYYSPLILLKKQDLLPV
jgi:hypothetical protein